MRKKGESELSADSACFCVALTSQSVQSWLVKQVDGLSQTVIASKRIPYHSPEETAVALDQSLRELGEEVADLETTVFCFSPDFIGQDDVVREKKPVIANLVSELQLDPIGFVSLQEAVVHHITQTSPQYSGVVGTIYFAFLELQLIDQGAIVASTRQPLLETAADTIQAGLVQLYSAITAPLAQQSIELAWVENHWSIEEWQKAVHQFDYTAHNWPVPLLVEVWSELEAMQVGVEYAGKVWLAAAVGNDPLLDASSRAFGADVSLQIAGQQLMRNQNAYSDNVPPVEKLRTPILGGLGKKKSRRKIVLACLLGVCLGVVALVLVGFGYVQTRSIAVLHVTPDSKTISAQVQFALDQKLAAPDTTNQKLPAKVLKTRLSATDSATATGTGFTGEKAKGKVTILNKTESQKTLTKGTELQTGAGNLVVVLTEDITLPPASISTQSGGVSEVKTYGTTTAQVEAQAIGEESNLAKDTALKVGDYAESTYAASVADNLTGGTKQQVAVVTAKDISQLTNKLKLQVQKDALAQFMAEASSDLEVVPQTSVTIVKVDPSAKENDQVNEIAIQLTADVSGLAYEKATVRTAGLTLLNAQVPPGYQLDEKSVQVLSEFVAPSASNSGKIDADLQASARAMIDTEKLKTTSAGQLIVELPPTLQRAGFPVQVTVTWQPTFSGNWLKSVPQSTSRIRVENTQSS